jgi:hypothetical protein
MKTRRQERVHQKGKLDDTDGKRTAADSRICFNALSPAETEERLRNVAYNRKISRFSNGILRKAVASLKSKLN